MHLITKETLQEHVQDTYEHVMTNELNVFFILKSHVLCLCNNPVCHLTKVTLLPPLIMKDPEFLT